MDFTLSEEQKMMQTAARDFAQEKLANVADKLDQSGEFPWDNFKALAELGLTGTTIPQEYGGSGRDITLTAIVLEEIAAACAATCDSLLVHLSTANLIYLYGTEDQRKRYLPVMATGGKIGFFAITEAEAGSDVGALQANAVRTGDFYTLNGTKIFVTNGVVGDIGIVLVKVPEHGFAAFILETGLQGFTKSKKYNKLGMRGATNCDFVFENCRVPVDNRLGQEGQGMKICLSGLDVGRIFVAAQAIGITRVVLEKALAYSKERIQFGAPISQNQGVIWPLADIATQLEAARLLNFKAASIADDGGQVSIFSAMSKLTATELCLKAAIQGMQTFGGYGYMMDSPMQRYFRDARLTTIYEGASEIQRIVISRAILR